jgi:hypothetical protein
MIPRVALAFPAAPLALKSLPIDLPSTLRPLAIITLKNRVQGPTGQLFAESVRELAKPLTKRKL